MTTQTSTLIQARKSTVFVLRKLPRVLALLVFFILFVFPIIWIAYNAMKTNNQLFDNPWALPAALNWDNFVYAWSAANVGIYFLNSLKVCVLALLISLLLSTTASFAITRMRWKLSPVVLGLFVASMMIPNNATLIPQFLLFSKLGLVNKHIALIILYAVAALPISIFILCGFMQAFPTDIEEAAVIDGANMVRMFFYITLPISTSAIATVAIFTFVSMWNDLVLCTDIYQR